MEDPLPFLSQKYQLNEVTNRPKLKMTAITATIIRAALTLRFLLTTVPATSLAAANLNH
jgi:hypothetical protein